MRYRLLAVFVSIWIVNTSFSQVNDSLMVAKIYSEALRTNDGFKNLSTLCELFPGRMVGTGKLLGAIEYTRKLMQSQGIDTVYLQPFDGPYWKPGDNSIASIHSDKMGTKSVRILPLGLSIGTGGKVFTAEVIEVMNFDELEKLGRKKVEGKIVFFNRPMPREGTSGMSGYGITVDQRTQGASQAARFGAIAAIVRSVTPSIDTFPHTGVMQYKEGITKIPAVAICTVDAETLHDWLKSDPNTAFNFQTNCQFLPPAKVYNVIGEIWGSSKPHEIITVGGHLDCWYNAAGAQDDGAGCIQSIELLRIFRNLNIRPRHTIRVVMFIDEEMTQSGANKYAEFAAGNNEKQLVAMESDRGGFKPIGMGISCTDQQFARYLAWQNYFKPFGIKSFSKGGGGTDVGPMEKLGAITCSFIPESDKYFNYHHSARDNIKAVDPNELALGSASMAAFIYLMDTKGF